MSGTVTYTLGESLRLTLALDQARYGLEPEDLFLPAVRQNPKRSFLFVSRVLGKHLPIRPAALLAAGRLLATAWDVRASSNVVYWSDLIRGKTAPPFAEVMDRLDRERRTLGPQERTLFVGFAETATGLAQAVADCFKGELGYINTTRHYCPVEKALTFEESHSHASTHRLYLDPEDPFLMKCQQAVLVDDELTTGNTALQLIRRLHRFYGIRRFAILALLDNSGGDARREMEEELGIEIQVVSLLHGQIVKAEAGPPPAPSLTEYTETAGQLPELLRFPLKLYSVRTLQTAGMLACQREYCRLAAKALGPQGPGTLFLGTGEFIYIPALIAGWCGVCAFHSTTQSPVLPMEGSAIQSGVHFTPTDQYSSQGFLYNVPQGVYDSAVVLTEEGLFHGDGLCQLTGYLSSRGVGRVRVAALGELMSVPPGSLSPEDVVLLVKDVTGQVEERPTAVREKEIQAGRHYSEDLPVEQVPSAAYMEVFDRLMETQLPEVALYTGILTRLVLSQYRNPVLVSLVRAGVPCGALMRRYAAIVLGQELPHYGVSIIRGKGFDENAIRFILDRHPGQPLVFVDGWTGKGMIATQLKESCEDFNRRNGTSLEPALAVLADPAHCCTLYATREDFINPSCCLNSTICGLISRTVHNFQLIGPEDFHGVRVYREYAVLDQTARYLDGVTRHFFRLQSEAEIEYLLLTQQDRTPDWRGMTAVRRIGEVFGIQDVNRIKPSIGETTRVLLRRIPDRVLVREAKHPDVAHILLLAEERGVPVMVYPDMPYLCCGLIADKRGDAE